MDSFTLEESHGCELKPTLPRKVKEVWAECGIYVTSIEHEAGEKEIEFFVEHLINQIAYDLGQQGNIDCWDLLTKLGYIKER